MASRGVRLLADDPLLLELSTYFTTEAEVISLATYLLQGIGQGGRSFVDSLPNQATSLKAHAVLVQWVTKKPQDAFGETLLSVLSKPVVKPNAATDFKEQLLAPPKSSGVTPEKRTKTADEGDGEPSRKMVFEGTAAENNVQPCVADVTAQREEDQLKKWRSHDVSEDHLRELEKTRAAEMWIRIARTLGLDDEDITSIQKRYPTDDRQCFRAFVSFWKDMDVQQTVGPFYDALVAEKLAGLAKKTFGVPPSA